MSSEPKNIAKPAFFGFLAVGFLSLVGGIFMFIFVVPRDIDPDGPSRDMGLIFTNVFMKQRLLFNERNRYAAALMELEVDNDTCARYSCLLSVQPDGKNYVFRLSKNGRTWAIEGNSLVPKEIR